MLSAIELSYHRFEELATALAALCYRVCLTNPIVPHGHNSIIQDMNLRPEEYPKPSVTADPVSLLSRIYDSLQAHLERQSSSLVTASLGYMLTTTSKQYITEVCLSVGLGGSTFTGKGDDRLFQTRDLLDGDEGEDEDIFASIANVGPEEFPTFIRPELADSLLTARKSLKILKAAQPDHPLLLRSSGVAGLIGWFWTADEIQAACAGEGIGMDRKSPQSAPVTEYAKTSPKAYHPDLASLFALFDLEPGATDQAHPSDYGQSARQPSIALSVPVESFISEFPTSSVSLHPLTPTLEHLTNLTFSPLMSHTVALSRALLDLFLPSSSINESTSNLNFREHAILLRSYLLLTSPAFKSRLSAALFSDSGDHLPNETLIDIRTRTQLLATCSGDRGDDLSRQWAVGLASGLTAQESWPPGGADLSFMLRTVIMDSLEAERNYSTGGVYSGEDGTASASQKNIVLEEGEWRLGFAIRDLPTGTGRDKWLNPACACLVFVSCVMILISLAPSY